MTSVPLDLYFAMQSQYGGDIVHGAWPGSTGQQGLYRPTSEVCRSGIGWHSSTQQPQQYRPAGVGIQSKLASAIVCSW